MIDRKGQWNERQCPSQHQNKIKSSSSSRLPSRLWISLCLFLCFFLLFCSFYQGQEGEDAHRLLFGQGNGAALTDQTHEQTEVYGQALLWSSWLFLQGPPFKHPSWRSTTIINVRVFFVRESQDAKRKKKRRTRMDLT